MDKKNIGVMELCEAIIEKHKILGDKDRCIFTASPIDKAYSWSVTFCSKYTNDALPVIRDSKAGVIICSDKLSYEKDDYKDRTLILASNPRLVFIQIIQKYFQSKLESGIHPTAIIDKDAKIYPNVYIGPNTCIMGKCEIGNNTIIFGNVFIYPNVKIGSNVTIDAGTVIGADGFSFERNNKGELLKFPHIGGVVIEDNVEIGSNVSIDRGTMDNTVIGQGTKIDNLCHIAHNVIIGKHCIIIAQSLIGGSTKIGDYCWIAPCTCLRDGIEIGENVLTGMGSVVTKSIESNSVIYGVPAKIMRKQPNPVKEMEVE